MIRLAILSLAFMIATVSAKTQKCTCGDGQEYTFSLPVLENQEVTSLNINQLDFPGGSGDYGNQFGQSTRSLIAFYVQFINQLREQNVNQQIIMEFENDKTELTRRINSFGSFSNEENFQRKMTELTNYLIELMVKYSNNAKATQDENLKNYYYSIILQLYSIRSFYISSLDNSRCIYSQGGNTGGNSGNGHWLESQGSGGKGPGKGGKGDGEGSGEKGRGKGGKGDGEGSGEKGSGKGGKGDGKGSGEKGPGKGGKGKDREDLPFWSPWSQQ